MSKKVMVTCTVAYGYEYEMEIPEGVDVEEYVYAYRLNCDEQVGTIPTIIDWGDIIVEDIAEEA